jgi:pyrroline-5-carboxylate reductase
MTFVAEDGATEEQTALVMKIFSLMGEAMLVNERVLEVGMVLASCGIAFALRYVRAAAEGGVELGIPAAQATQIVAATLKGAAELLLRNGSHPEQEIDKVTTAGGITIKGLNEMEHAGFTSAVIRGLKASAGK